MKKSERLPQIPLRPVNLPRPVTSSVRQSSDLKDLQKLPSVSPAPPARSDPRRSTFERLATPKFKNCKFLPDKPSVYWLDYLIDPTPHKIKNPEELASYYENFEPKFPRTRFLSTPRKFFYVTEEDEIALRSKPPTSEHGIPVSALSYEASDRIKALSRPKTTLNTEEVHFERMLRERSRSRQPSVDTLSLPSLSAASSSTKVKTRSSDHGPFKVDHSRGDFPRHKPDLFKRSNHKMHAKKKASTTSLERNNNFNNRRPQTRSRFSMKM